MRDPVEQDHLLVIDFDFFFPNQSEMEHPDPATKGLYDWGHAEAPFFIDSPLWTIRASTFTAFDLPLPQVTVPDGGWSTFWGRFTLTDDATIAYGDSNAHAGDLQGNTIRGAYTSIHLFDAHHDSGYRVKSLGEFLDRGEYSCEDWMLYQQAKGCHDLTVHYPTWKPNGLREKTAKGSLTRQVIDDGQPLATAFSTVYVCRSGAWVPPWCDTDFVDFIDAAPAPATQIDDALIPRSHDAVSAEEMANQIRASRNRR
jgi:hypothetical protein